MDGFPKDVCPNAEGPVFPKAPNPEAGLIAPPNGVAEPNAGVDVLAASAGAGASVPNIPEVPNPGFASPGPIEEPPSDSPPSPASASAAIGSSEADMDKVIGEAKG